MRKVSGDQFGTANHCDMVRYSDHVELRAELDQAKRTMEEVAGDLIALAKYHYGDDSEIFVSPARDHLRSLATKLTGGDQ
jgi:hypothetical protein